MVGEFTRGDEIAGKNNLRVLSSLSYYSDVNSLSYYSDVNNITLVLCNAELLTSSQASALQIA